MSVSPRFVIVCHHAFHHYSLKIEKRGGNGCSFLDHLFLRFQIRTYLSIILSFGLFFAQEAHSTIS
ncbi:hypothetical protein I656_00574 [Geobacillus sp. WSUCF1]|nr:hypothetical protein I656_00574 [Geobacillus sp. WSUCF1]